LLGEWVADRSDERSIAWLSLDEADNDPARFLSYLVAALQSIVEEEIGEGFLSSLPSPQPPIEALVTTLLNQIVELPAELILILEDYHVIDSELFHGPPPFYEVT
jgi:LuxR family maltose regulon positive regulatory protein